MLRAEADAIISLRYCENFVRAGRLGEFERRLVYASAQAARGESLGHALVKFDARRVRLRAPSAAQELEQLPAAQPDEDRGGEQEEAGRNGERRRQYGEQARAAAACPPRGQARAKRVGGLRRAADGRADALLDASRERLLTAPIISDDVT